MGIGNCFDIGGMGGVLGEGGAGDVSKYFVEAEKWSQYLR